MPTAELSDQETGVRMCSYTARVQVAQRSPSSAYKSRCRTHTDQGAEAYVEGANSPPLSQVPIYTHRYKPTIAVLDLPS
eukprot:scaffold161944_cov18-Tisochrysis_lutea.AAC.1